MIIVVFLIIQRHWLEVTRPTFPLPIPESSGLGMPAASGGSSPLHTYMSRGEEGE